MEQTELAPRANKPSASRGFTLLEVSMGLAIGGVMALVTGQLLKTGIGTYRYSMRQMFVVSGARRAFHGTGAANGLIAGIQDARSMVSLSTGSLSMFPASGATIDYLLSDESLVRSELSVQTKLAVGITGISPSYYSLDSQGRIMVSTAPATAALVTASINLEDNQNKAYSFFAGALLRNMP